MSDDPDKLRELRADKANDGRLWEPLDALRAMIRDIENGTVKDVDQILIIYRRKTGEKDRPHSNGYSQAGMDRPNHLAMLELHKFYLLHDWVGE